MNRTQSMEAAYSTTGSSCYDLMKYLGKFYQVGVLTTENGRRSGELYSCPEKYDEYLQYVNAMNEALELCEPQTRLMVLNEYLMDSPRNWYARYFSRSHYYAMRERSAVCFLEKLKLVVS